MKKSLARNLLNSFIRVSVLSLKYFMPAWAVLLLFAVCVEVLFGAPVSVFTTIDFWKSIFTSPLLYAHLAFLLFIFNCFGFSVVIRDYINSKK